MQEDKYIVNKINNMSKPLIFLLFALSFLIIVPNVYAQFSGGWALANRDDIWNRYTAIDIIGTDIFVTGYTWNGTRARMSLIGLDKNGNLYFNQILGNVTDSLYGMDITHDSENNLIIVGYKNVSNEYYLGFIGKYDTDGIPIWNTSYIGLIFQGVCTYGTDIWAVGNKTIMKLNSNGVQQYNKTNLPNDYIKCEYAYSDFMYLLAKDGQYVNFRDDNQAISSSFYRESSTYGTAYPQGLAVDNSRTAMLFGQKNNLASIYTRKFSPDGYQPACDMTPYKCSNIQNISKSGGVVSDAFNNWHFVVNCPTDYGSLPTYWTSRYLEYSTNCGLKDTYLVPIIAYDIDVDEDGNVVFVGSNNITDYSQNIISNINYIITNGTCFDITTSGYYKLGRDIIGTKEPCIKISTNDTVLDMNGFNITPDDTSITHSLSGIYMIPDCANCLLQNITIKNGKLDWFSGVGIFMQNVNNVTIENMKISRSHMGILIASSTNVTIINNNFTENRVGLESRQWKCHNFIIKDNYFLSTVHDLELGCLFNSLVIGNRFGNVMIDSSFCRNSTAFIPYFYYPYEVQTCVIPTNQGPQFGIFGGADIGIYGTWVNYTDFVGNMIYAEKDADFSISGSNRFIKNTFFRTGGTDVNGLFLNPTTNNNYGCGNQGYIYNSGYNNTFVAECPSYLYPNVTTGGCLAEWVCLNDQSYAYRLPDCSYTSQSSCASGQTCVNGTCSSTGLQKQKESEGQTPLTGFGSYGTGLGFIDVIFTPFFLVTIMALGISGYISTQTADKNAGEHMNASVFGISMIIFALAFTYFGLYPVWIGIVLIIIVSLWIAKTFGVIGGGK